MRKSLREVSDSNAQGPVRTTTKIEFGVCKKGEKFVITNFFVFVILFASRHEASITGFLIGHVVKIVHPHSCIMGNQGKMAGN